MSFETIVFERSIKEISAFSSEKGVISAGFRSSFSFSADFLELRKIGAQGALLFRSLYINFFAPAD